MVQSLNAPANVAFCASRSKGNSSPSPCPAVGQSNHARSKIIELRNGDEVYHEMGPKEMSFESDAAVFERLKWACFESQGRWRKWIPFYGITNVEEIKVSHPYRDREFPP